MSIEDDIAAQLAELESEEQANLEEYKLSHPEDFPTEERISHDLAYFNRGLKPPKFRTSLQKAKAARKAKRQRARKKQREELEAAELGLDLTLSDKRIKRIKVYKIQVGKNKNKQ